MNNSPNESQEEKNEVVETLTNNNVETLDVSVKKSEIVETLTNNNVETLDVSVKKSEEIPVTAEQIVRDAEEQANKAAADYNKKDAPVAPQQDRVQLIDTKPKLHAVKLGGVAMSMENKADIENIQAVESNLNELSSVENSVDNVGPSKARVIGLVTLFIGLLVIVIFLPDISSYISTKNYLHSQSSDEKITTGTLQCTMEDSSDNLDFVYKFNFEFKNNGLTGLKSISEVRGDINLDEAELDKLNQECELLNIMVKDLEGISVSCKLSNGLFTKKQTFKFSSIEVDDAITAYIEAGGHYPNYYDGDNIDKIEKSLIGANYNCKRVK